MSQTDVFVVFAASRRIPNTVVVHSDDTSNSVRVDGEDALEEAMLVEVHRRERPPHYSVSIGSFVNRHTDWNERRFRISEDLVRLIERK